VVQLYDQLLVFTPTPVVLLNRAVAVAELDGPATALAIVDGLDLEGYHLLHATRAELLERLGRDVEAVDAYNTALALVTNRAEARLLEARRAALISE